MKNTNKLLTADRPLEGLFRMEKLSFIIFAILSVLLSVALSTVFSDKTNAITDYDTSINKAIELKASDYYGDNDVSFDHNTLIEAFDGKSCESDLISSFIDGTYVVTIQDYDNSYNGVKKRQDIEISYQIGTTSHTNALYFNSFGSGYQSILSNGTSWYKAFVQIEPVGTNTVSATCGSPESAVYTGWTSDVIDDGGYPTTRIFSTQNIIVEYPPDWGGISIPQNPYVSPTTSSAQPDWYASISKNWLVDLHDKNFNTFDKISWTCSEDGNTLIDNETGLAPVLYWQIYDDSGDTPLMLIDGYNSATAPIQWQAPKDKSNKVYRIVGWYECGGDVDFTEASNFEFAIDKNGNLNYSSLASCFTETFPFVDLPACISNFGEISNMLSFGVLNFGNKFDATPCKKLTVVDEWLNTPDITVCPMIPEYVRNVITPFVVFALSLLMIQWLTRQSGGNG